VKSLQGHLLVASPQLLDPNFLRSVILVVQHNDEGALGVTLNRKTDALLKQVWGQVSTSPCASEESLFLGGPCQGPLLAIHLDESLANIEILPGVYYTAESEKLEQLVADKDKLARFFAGYAGWGAGQLEKELSEGAWQTLPAGEEYVFHTGDDLWQTLRKSLASDVLLSTLHIKHVPPDPSMN